MAQRPLPRSLLIGLAALALLLLLAGVGLYLAAPSSNSEGPPADFYAMGHERRPSGELPVLWAAPGFSFTSHTGEPVTASALKGHVWIADFIFTRCTSVCPLITAQMTSLQRRITDPTLRFVSFSVDPEHDTQQVLAEYARKWNRNDTRWSLLVTNPADLERVARDMRVAVAPSDDPTNPILHTNLFMLVDQEGQVRGAYNSSDRIALERLEQDAKSLLGTRDRKADPDAPAVVDGAALYSALRCAACHDDSRIAPALGGVGARTVKLEGGGEVTADAAYLREALVTPGAHIVAGYLPLMPSYRQELTDAQVGALVKYLSALEPTEPAEAAAAALVLDPICKMKVRAASSTPHVEHDGQTVYFCSETCRERFTREAAPL